MTNFHIYNNSEIAITDKFGTFIISNKSLGNSSFKEAQEKAKENNMHCPSRIECIRLWDAISYGLNEELKKIGADPIDKYIWTCDRWKDPKNENDNIAWFFCGTDGSLYCDCENDTTPVCRGIINAE